MKLGAYLGFVQNPRDRHRRSLGDKSRIGHLWLYERHANMVRSILTHFGRQVLGETVVSIKRDDLDRTSLGGKLIKRLTGRVTFHRSPFRLKVGRMFHLTTFARHLLQFGDDGLTPVFEVAATAEFR